MIDTIKRIHAAAGSPSLNSHHAANQFTAQVAATLHFGSQSLGIAPDPSVGRRRNPSNILSDDVIGFKGSNGVEYFDYIRGAGSSNWEFVWQGSSSGPWVAPSIDDVVGGAAPGEPNPSPNPGNPNPSPIIDIKPILDAIFALHNEVLRLREAHDSHESASEQRYSNHGDQHRLMNQGLEELLRRR
jgi:hypothetical protein